MGFWEYLFSPYKTDPNQKYPDHCCQECGCSSFDKRANQKYLAECDMYKYVCKKCGSTHHTSDE